MKLQFCKTRVVKDAMTVWYEHGPEVDLVMDLKKPGFAPGSIEVVYAFHVLEHLFPDEVIPTLRAWKDILAPGGKMFLVNDDFEFLCRSLIGGDLGIGQFNADFTHPTYFTRDNLIESLTAVGFLMDNVIMWYAPEVADAFKKAEHELILEARNV